MRLAVNQIFSDRDKPQCEWRVRRRKMLAAAFTETAIANHTNPLDNGPEVKGKALLHPRLEAKLQAARAYPEKTAGPIKAATKAPNSCAVSVAHDPVRESKPALACNTATTFGESVLIATAVVRVSGMSNLRSF
jgi:hypothetical protein